MRDVKDRVVPYPGLRPFGEKDRAIFFGREAQMVAVLALLQEQQFVAVVGSSGSGKSSLILAGVIPAVREGFLRSTSDWKTIVLKPGGDPCGNLARALEREGFGQEPAIDSTAMEEAARQTSAIADPTTLPRAEEEPQTLVEKLHAADRSLIDLVTPQSGRPEGARGESEERSESSGSSFVAPFAPSEEPSGPHVLVVVDQFEELFAFRRIEAETGPRTGRYATRDEAATFVRLLLRACAEPDGRIAVIITMRSDFIGDCDAFLELPELVSRCQFLVPRLDRSQMREAIERPGQIEDLGCAPFRFENGLVNHIIAEAGDRIDQLPLMQHALMRTWKEAGGPDAPLGKLITLTEEHYEKAGRISGALSKHADLAWATIKDDAVKARLTRELFLLLSDVHPDGKIVRRRPLLTEVQAVTGADIPAIEEIVRLFQSDDRNFLLPPLKEGEHLKKDDHLDISHEALLRQWMEFSRWLVQEAEWKIWLQELSQAAKDYERAPETELWHGNDLLGAEVWIKEAQPSEAWARRHGVRNWDQCLAFLDLSRNEAAQLEEREREEARQHQEEKERHQKKILRISRIVGFNFLLFGGAMLFLWFQGQKSENRAKDAINLFGSTADDVALPITAYAASALAAAEQQVAKLTAALANAGTEPPPDKAALDELLDARNNAEEAATAIEKLAASLNKAAVDMTKDSDFKHTAALLTAEAAKVRQRRDALQRNPETLALIKKSIVQRLERIEQQLAGLLGSENPDPALVLAKDQDVVNATSEFDAILAIQPAAKALGFNDDDFAEFEERGKRIGYTLTIAREVKEAASSAPRLALWRKEVALELTHRGRVNSVRFAPVLIDNASLIASAGEDKTVRFWDRNGKTLAERVISSPINDIAFSPLGNALAVASDGNTVRVFRWTGAVSSTAITETVFERHSDSITDVEFSHGGERIVSSSEDRTVRVFDSRTMAQLYFTSPPLPAVVTSVAFHPGDNLVVSGCVDGGVRRHTVIDRKEVVLLGEFDATARRPEFSSDGKFIVAASGDQTARVWRTSERFDLIRINHLAPVTQATFRPTLDANGYSFITTATNGEVRLVQFSDTASKSANYPGQILEPRHPGTAASATWSRDGRWLATVGGGEVILWEWTNGSPVARLRMVDLHPATSRAEFSPDARLLVTYGGDEFAHVWDLTKLPAAAP